MTTGPLVLEAGEARLIISPTEGGRMTSLVVGEHELLVTEGYGPIRWGCYPMAPFAGRIRDGRFTFRGRAVALPRNLPPHAIHGTVFERPWTVTGPDRLAIDLGPDWPFAGRVEQALDLRADGLEATLTLIADEPMPATLGWHPWFRWTVAGARAILTFDPGAMYQRGTDDLPTGALVPPGPRPWDDCFTAVASPPRIRWPGVLDLEIASSADHWIVYDATTDGLCVEPQTGPPDAVNLDPRVVAPGAPLRATMTWRWSPAG